MNLERTILTNLSRARDGMMAVTTLWAEVSLDQPDATYSQFKLSLQELEVKGQAVVVPGEDRDKAKITQAGKARLME